MDGCVDVLRVIADKFANHFKATFSCNDAHKAETLKRDFTALRANYNGLPLIEAQYFDVELVSNTIANLKRGKAADIEGISAEHLSSLSSLFARSPSQTFSVDDLFLLHPRSFRYNYIVPIPKPKECCS